MGRGGKSLDKIIYQMSHDDEKLINVDLAGKNISDHGAIRLSSVLAWNSFVKTLDLSRNDVGPVGHRLLPLLSSKI